MSIIKEQPFDDYFKKITLQIDYFFGLISTDGSISSDLKNEKRRKLSIKLKVEDAHILKTFILFNKKNYIILGKTLWAEKIKSNPTCVLEISSDKIHSDLIKLGVGKNKTIFKFSEL